MYTISSIRTIATPTTDGDFYYDAEAKICISDNGSNNDSEAFILVHWDADIYRFFYACTRDSIFDLVTDYPEKELRADFIEKFDFIEEAITSEFIDLYRMLDKILLDMFKNPTKSITYQAKILDTKTKADIIEETEGIEEQYFFSVTQFLEYAGDKYEITFYTKTDHEGEIVLKKGSLVLERYDDLQDAGASKWFSVFCRVKETLIQFIKEYFAEHPDSGLNFSWVTRDLYKDWVDLKSEIWLQK